MSIFRRPLGHLHLRRSNERGRAIVTTSDVGRLRRKSAEASDRPGWEREQPSMKVVTVKFGGSKEERMGIRSVFLWVVGFSVMNRRMPGGSLL